MRKFLFVATLLATVPTSTRADQDVGTVRDSLDAAVSAVVEGGRGALADDATFLRRAWVDLAGHVPPAPFAREFLVDTDPGKRGKLVDRLLYSDDFADHWGRVLAIEMTSERPVSHDGHDGRVLHEFLSDRLRKKAPYDKIVREVIAGSGASDTSGPANFYLRYDADPPRLAGAVGKNFLGVTIQCAQCHDHPFARWKEQDFWGLAATFARVRKMEAAGDGNLKAVIEARRGELMHPSPGPDPDESMKKGEGDDKPEPKKVCRQAPPARRQADGHRRSPGRPGRLGCRPRQPPVRPEPGQPRLGRSVRQGPRREPRRPGAQGRLDGGPQAAGRRLRRPRPRPPTPALGRRPERELRPGRVVGGPPSMGASRSPVADRRPTPCLDRPGHRLRRPDRRRPRETHRRRPPRRSEHRHRRRRARTRPRGRGARRAGLDLAAVAGAPERRVRPRGRAIGRAGLSGQPGAEGRRLADRVCLPGDPLSTPPRPGNWPCSTRFWSSRTGWRTSTGSCSTRRNSRESTEPAR